MENQQHYHSDIHGQIHTNLFVNSGNTRDKSKNHACKHQTCFKNNLEDFSIRRNELMNDTSSVDS